MSKVRRIDWSPDEWLAGTRGLLTQREAAVYMAVLMVIYSRAAPCPNDPGFIAGQFKPGHHESAAALARATRAALDRLIELDKLHLSADQQWLTNGRADAELNKARERIGGAVRAGYASGRARRAKRHDLAPTSRGPRADPQPKSSSANGLARTAVRNHQPPYDHESEREISTVAAREPSPEPQAAQARALTGPDPPAVEVMMSPGSARERVAQLARERRAKLAAAEQQPETDEAKSQRERLAAAAAKARAKLMGGDQ